MRFHPLAAICLTLLECSVVVLLIYVRYLRELIEEAVNSGASRLDTALKEQSEAVQRIENLEADLAAVSKSRDRMDLLHADLVRTVGITNGRIDMVIAKVNMAADRTAALVEPMESRIGALEAHRADLAEIASLCTVQEMPDRLSELEKVVAQLNAGKPEKKDPAGSPLRSFADQRTRFEMKLATKG